MKQFFLFLSVLISGFSFSQEDDKPKFLIAKNTTEITGNIGFWYDSDNSEGYDTKSFTLNFSPNIGYAIKNNLVIGLGGGYSFGVNDYIYEDNTVSSQKRTTNSFSVSPYLKKYFPISKKVAFSLKGEAGYSHRNEKHEHYNANEREYNNKYNGATISLSPGISLLVTKKLMLNLRIGAFGLRTGTEKRYDGNVYQSKSKETNFDFALNNNYFTSGLTFLIQ